ncbi:hypothetical protein F2Q69_00046663 [Brassica cretica]|uniref:Peptidase S9A N-terminal domain-containing protein n=1 Tax=Brassica cretica TaxID=69181 RepID=A0A8S9PW96_BRACR|nr:hypothetical protein F2Q69_00046663 [Brassica cretica]
MMMIVRRGLVAAHFVAPHLRPLTPLLPRRRSDPRLCSSYSSPSLRITASGDMAETRSPPVAKKVEHVMQMFGDVRVDNYYWLRTSSNRWPCESYQATTRDPSLGGLSQFASVDVTFSRTGPDPSPELDSSSYDDLLVNATLFCPTMDANCSFEKLQEDAFTFAFMMKVLDMIPASV